jgi:hypothetical protein
LLLDNNKRAVCAYHPTVGTAAASFAVPKLGTWIQFITDNVEDPEKFVFGLQQRLRDQSPEGRQELDRYFGEWLVSARLLAEPVWQERVADRGDPDAEVVMCDELRRRSAERRARRARG